MSSSRSTDDPHQVAPNIESFQDELFPDIPKRSSKMRAHARRARKRSASASARVRRQRAHKPQSETTRASAKTEERLRRSEMLLAQAEQLANIGSWELDLRTERLHWSAHFYRLLGLKPRKGPMTRDWGLNLIHPDDRDRGGRDLEATRTKGVPLDNEMRFFRADGAVRVFHSRAVAITDKQGKIVCIRGMSQDVTESRAAEIKMRESENLLSNAEEIAHLGSWEFDVGPAAARLSKNLRKIYGFAADEEFTRESYQEHIHPRDRARVRRMPTRHWRRASLLSTKCATFCPRVKRDSFSREALR